MQTVLHAMADRQLLLEAFTAAIASAPCCSPAVSVAPVFPAVYLLVATGHLPCR